MMNIRVKGIGNRIRVFMKEDDGIGTLEMLLILAIVVVIAIAFRKWIMHWLGNLFSKANDDINNNFINSVAPNVTPPPGS
jgi:Flp pilus assembly pilin Flp